jgi:hypothetical protein
MVTFCRVVGRVESTPTIADFATSPWTLLYVLPKFAQSGHISDYV